MPSSPKTLCFVALCLCVVVGEVRSSERTKGWKTFTASKHRYTVQFPGWWYLFQAEEHLDILNFPPSERVKGVVLKPGGAEIAITPAAPDIHTAEEWVQQERKYGDTLQDSGEAMPNPPAGACADIRIVASRSEAGEHLHFIHTYYYCMTTNGLYSLLLTNWDGDPNQARLRETAKKTILSLRAWAGDHR